MQDKGGQGSHIEWLMRLTITSLTEKTGDLTLYCELAKIVGPRGTMEGRTDEDHCFAVIKEGGMLARRVRAYYHPDPGEEVSLGYLCRQIPTFLKDTQWPEVWRHEKENWFDYAQDLVRRAGWRKANRQEWVTIAEDRIVPTLARHFPKLAALFEDMVSDTSKLAREYQKLADQLLPDIPGATKLPFWQIEEVEAHLDEAFGGLIAGKATEGATTAEMLTLIHARLLEGKSGKTKRGDDGGGAGDDTRGPRVDQVLRAMQTDEQVVKFEAKAAGRLESSATTLEDLMNVLAEAFAIRNLPVKAVLLAAKGQRLSAYTAASDFLAQLHEHRHLMPRFLAMCLAFDEATGKVPEALKYLSLDEEDVRLICDAEWVKLDAFNKLVLQFRAKMAGTKYALHDTKAIYHDPAVLADVTSMMGRLFDTIGYPKEVSAAEGVTYRGFMALVAELLQLALAMTPDEQRGAFREIDDAVRGAMIAAAAHYLRIVYSANPADRRLTFWLASHEPVLAAIKERLSSSREQITWRIKQGAIYGEPQQAPSLPGHVLHSGGKRTVGETGATKEARGRTPSPGRNPKKPKGTSQSPRGGSPKQPAKPTAVTSATKQVRGTWTDPPDLRELGGGKFYMGGFQVDWHGVCKLYGWDAKKLHGPWVMASSLGGDPKTLESWVRPAVGGKPFLARDHAEQLEKAGLRVPTKPTGGREAAGGQGRPKRGGSAAASTKPHFG